eukprot:SAG31_NODE_6408_length_2014_cov_1.395132_1_plen_70_part_00
MVSFEHIELELNITDIVLDRSNTMQRIARPTGLRARPRSYWRVRNRRSDEAREVTRFLHVNHGPDPLRY